METILLWILKSVYFILPAYFGNMIPVILRKRFKFLAKPIDCGAKFYGKPLFGKNKTWRGLIGAMIVGAIVFQIQILLYNKGIGTSIVLFDYSSSCFLFGALLGLGAIVGDLIESFFKRRFGIKPGKPWIPFDQTDFIIGALLISHFRFVPPWQVWVTLIVLTPLLHIACNHAAFYLKLRKQKW